MSLLRGVAAVAVIRTVSHGAALMRRSATPATQ
jgi:hypothetical protein